MNDQPKMVDGSSQSEFNEVPKEVKVAETLPKNVPPIKDDPKIDVVKVGRQM